MAVTRDQVVVELIAQTRDAVGGIKQMLTSIVGVIAAVKSFEAVARQAFASAQMAAALNQQGDAFMKLADSAGQSGAEILAAMENASGGVVTQLDLMRSASRASLLGIGFENMPKLLEISRAAARATGQDMAFMFDSITTGVGRASPLILDNLGITIKLEETYAAYAVTLNKTSSELTSVEQKQAILNAVLEQGQGIIDRTGTRIGELTDVEKWDMMTRAIKEFVTEAGQSFNELFAGPVGILATGLLGFVQGRQNERSIREFFEKLEESAGGFAQFTRIELSEALLAFGQRISQINMLVEEFEGQGGGAADMVRNWKRELSTLTPTFTDIEAFLATANRAGGIRGALTGEGGDGGDDIVALAQDVGLLAASLGEIDQIVTHMRMTAGLGGADIGLGAALGLGGVDVPKFVAELTEVDQIMRQMGEGIFRGGAQSFVDGMRSIGESIAMGADGAASMAAGIKTMIQSLMSTLSQQLLIAGLQMIINAGPDAVRVYAGLGLIAASGLVALGGGLASGGGGGSNVNSTLRSPSTSGSRSGAMSALSQPANTIIIQNIGGSVVTERQIAANVARLMR